MEQHDLRVSDTEREHIAELLQRAVGEGYITLAEFEQRADAALAAKTRGELNSVIADLPGFQQAEPQSLVPDSRPSDPTQVSEIRGTGTEIKRKGAWHVPAALRVHSRFTTTVLDFSEAVINSPVVDIEIDDKAGSTKLIVPESATVDCDGLDVSWGELSNKAPSGPPRGRPHLVVHGRVRAGEVRIRPPRKASWWDKMLD